MSYSNTKTAECRIEDADDANVPVNVFVCPPSEENPKWRLIASNFMPRKGRVSGDVYEVEADSKEELQAVVDQYIVPLYAAAITNLKNGGELYYWS